LTTIVTRAGKGSPLTNNEVDANFVNLNDAKIETLTSTDSSVTITGTGSSRNLSASVTVPVSNITSIDGSVVISDVATVFDLSVGTAANTGTLIAQVRNETGATLTKGTVVYPAGAAGNKMLVQKALATSDATSAQTYGMIQADISNNQNGFVVIIGEVTGLNTLGLTEGGIVYLSPTVAGGYTQTKPSAPNHLVYVGIVTRVHANQGVIQARVQNGYELDEIHDVAINSATLANGQTIIYDASTSLWKNANLTAGTGISVTNGASSISIANTAPDQVVGLTGAGTTAVTGTYPNFTITSSDAYTGTVTNVTGTAPIAVANGTTTPAVSISQATTSTDGYLSATDWNTFNNKYTLPSQTGNDGKVLTTDGSTATWQPVDADPAGTAVAMAIALG